jgi:hypothetical protein
MPVLGDDINPVGADALWVRFRVQLVFLRLRNQVFPFVVGVPVDLMQERKAVLS